MLTLMLLYISSGLLLAALSIPLIRRKIKPNGLFGFRVSATMENPELWYKVNEFAGRRLLVVGIAIALAALLLYVWPGLNLTVDSYALSVMGVVFGLLIWAMITSFLYLKSLT